MDIRHFPVIRGLQVCIVIIVSHGSGGVGGDFRGDVGSGSVGMVVFERQLREG